MPHSPGGRLKVLAAAFLIAAATHGRPVHTQSTTRFTVVEKTIEEMQAAMASGAVTSADLVDQYLARIQAYDRNGPGLSAFITVNSRARSDAAALDRERRAGKVRGPLHGIPLVIKDNYGTVEMPTTAGTKALEGFETGRDAFVVGRLRDAGAVFIGKSNLHELAYGITNISSMGGQTRNPYDPSRTPGGSSGGTGAAVAASFGAAGLGTDTCGSIRNPSSSNNLFGIRPTAGLTSRTGIVPLSLTQDTSGPLARGVVDLALLLDVMAAYDPTDPVTKSAQRTAYRTGLTGASLKGVRIGLLLPLFGTAPDDAEVAGIVRKALDSTRANGTEIIELALPELDTLLQGTSVINAEFKHDLDAFLAQYPKAPVRTLAEIVASGKYNTAVDGVLKRANAVAERDTDAYRQALAKRDAARQAIIDVLKSQKLDGLAYPTLRRKPALIGQGQGGSNCQLSATTGLPAMGIPAGFTADGLPIGFDLLGDAFSESKLLRIAYAYEQAVKPRRPPPTTP